MDTHLPIGLHTGPDDDNVQLPWYQKYPLKLQESLSKPFTITSYLAVGALLIAGIILFMLFLSKGCAPGAGPG